MCRYRRWAAGFQSGNAAVDAVHMLYYNTNTALGNVARLMKFAVSPLSQWGTARWAEDQMSVVDKLQNDA